MLAFQHEFKTKLRRKEGAKMPFREALKVCGLRIQDAPIARRTLTIMGGRVRLEHDQRVLVGFELKAK